MGIKFLCSYGGKFSDGSSDGNLIYVGGTTKVIRLSNGASWQQLREKTMAMYKQPHTIKYQLSGEDPDVLVSVHCDEDLKHMLRFGVVGGSTGSEKLFRLFLFPGDSIWASVEVQQSDASTVSAEGKVASGSSDYGPPLASADDKDTVSEQVENPVVKVEENIENEKIKNQKEIINKQVAAMRRWPKPPEVLIMNKQVAAMRRWPKPPEVLIMNTSKAMKKPVGILHVNVVRVCNLKQKFLLGKSDLYVKLELTVDKLPSKKTSVKCNNLNPEWNEKFMLAVKDPESQALELTLFHWEQVGKHDQIGMNVIPLKELTADEPKSMILDLLKNIDPNDTQNEKSHGQIIVEVVYNPFREEEVPTDIDDSADAVEKAPEGTPLTGGLLVVIVHEAQDLEGKHHTNPYVWILFRGMERKTKYIKKNRDPRWEETFQFLCEEPPTDDKLVVEVLSRPPSISIHSKETLGFVIIDLAYVVSNKRINETYYLIDSRNGRIQIELQWRTAY